MDTMFECTEIKGIKLSNRFVRSATWEGMAAKDGAVTSQLRETMGELAKGEVGLIISGHAYVRPEGQAGLRQLGVYQDDLIPGLREMTAAVHECGGKIVLQIAHAGIFASEKLSGRQRLVVSNSERKGRSSGRELTTKDIRELLSAFGDAARRAKDAGFDGVQIHSAHGYLLNQFLSPAFNHRMDEYGGEIGNRARIHVEICQAIRKNVGEDYPLFIKLNSRDFIENGLSLEDSLQAGSLLVEAGVDAIELSGGVITGGKLSPSRLGIDSHEKEAYFREAARSFKNSINVPLILVGGIRSFEVAQSLVEDGTADYISMSRPFICEPDLIKRWKSGDRSQSKCISDNKCFAPGRKGIGIYCVEKSNENSQ
ncbi:2,4-dienoyl-coa reductase [hydrocarbon metagenome]|uniref:2,4-dienoyl-coa reductase n=1 Tax=hydrocarbon metagenome TaxID=938273 RepID=A0A0W8EA30_9ZZZZ